MTDWFAHLVRGGPSEVAERRLDDRQNWDLPTTSGRGCTAIFGTSYGTAARVLATRSRTRQRSPGRLNAVDAYGRTTLVALHGVGYIVVWGCRDRQAARHHHRR
jgi:hypothetical protein